VIGGSSAFEKRGGEKGRLRVDSQGLRKFGSGEGRPSFHRKGGGSSRRGSIFEKKGGGKFMGWSVMPGISKKYSSALLLGERGGEMQML